MKIGTENIDEVLFDYFEGNLSELEKKEVKQFIDANPLYLEDFRLWEVSNAKQYISEPIVADKSLLKKGAMSASIKWLLMISGVVCVVLTIVLMLSGKKEDETKAVETTIVPDSKPEQYVPIENTVKDQPVNSTKRQLQKKSPVPEAKENTGVVSNTVPVISEKAVTDHDSMIIAEDHIVQKIGLQKEDSSSLGSKEPEVVTKKELTKRELRKEAREIEKHKQRAKDKRQQQEFMKGHKPYVVPLNPKGF